MGHANDPKRQKPKNQSAIHETPPEPAMEPGAKQEEEQKNHVRKSEKHDEIEVTNNTMETGNALIGSRVSFDKNCVRLLFPRMSCAISEMAL